MLVDIDIMNVLNFLLGHMTDLINTEKDLVTSLKDYIKAEESKLEEIKKYGVTLI